MQATLSRMHKGTNTSTITVAVSEKAV